MKLSERKAENCFKMFIRNVIILIDTICIIFCPFKIFLCLYIN